MKSDRSRGGLRHLTRRGLFAAGGAGLTLLALTGCTPAGLFNSVSRIGGESTRPAVRGAPYGPLARHRLDVWAPPGDAFQEKLPVVVFFHGGGWAMASRGEYGFAGRAFAARALLPSFPITGWSRKRVF